MKISVPANSASSYPVSGDYLFISSAVGNVEVTWQTENGPVTGQMGQGETIQMRYTSLSFSGLGNAQEIDIRAGYGQYTPPLSAITSTVIDQIRNSVRISSIESAVGVEKINQPVSVSQIDTAVAVSGINTPVAVSKINAAVAVSGIESPLLVSGIESTVDVTGEVGVDGLNGAAFRSNDYLIPVGGYVNIPANDRNQIIFQSLGENLTRCRISNTDATEAGGLWLIGGGDLFGESPILRTKAALRVWNISENEAVITVNEVY